MNRRIPGSAFVVGFALLFFAFVLPFGSAASTEDASAMLALKAALSPPESLGWTGLDPCKWNHVACSTDGRVTRVQIGRQNLPGTLPPDIQNLTRLERLELQWNGITGPLPTLKGLSSLEVLMLSNNKFSSIPSDFFDGLSSLQSVEIDHNPFASWVIPDGLKHASSLQNFSANSANVTGLIPEFFSPDSFPELSLLHLSFNDLQGVLPVSFGGSQIQSLWLNGQKNKLSGSIEILQNMTLLREVWLHSNAFGGPLPDFSSLKSLESLSLRDNLFTGVVPESLVSLESLKVVNLTNNLLQGHVPEFKSFVSVDMNSDSNCFCLPVPGNCDPQVSTLLLIAKSFGYPQRFPDSWKGNDPCADWFGITCRGGNITVINFQDMGLNGTISPEFAQIRSLERLVLADNHLTGIIPLELTTLSGLQELDVSNNNVSGAVPAFRSNVKVKTLGNSNIGKVLGTLSNSTSLGTSALNPAKISSDKSGNDHKKPPSVIGLVVFFTLVGVLVLLTISLLTFCLYKQTSKRLHKGQSTNAFIFHPQNSGSDSDSVKVTVAGSSMSVGAISESHISTRDQTDKQMVEAGNMVISIQVLKNVTNNFSEANILGRGGFGVVYRGELHDGTKIAVKRMDSEVINEKGLAEFKSEIAVLTKVRHRHLVALLGYCLDGQEKLLVYEHMPQGTLSRRLFDWAAESLAPLEWKRRLIIALDVARGVEYLHSLAYQSFIHRDLKPSNILLDDELRAKVSDFGLVRLAPEGKGSVHTRIAGTFGYLAPEYAVTGRVTTKVDVFSFGVILMELITGRKALDESQPEESMHLVTWFRRMYLTKDLFRKAIDPTFHLSEETLASIMTVAELAGHCSAREPYQRPDMGHVVNVLSSLVELWKPSDQSSEDPYGIDLEMSLPQALKKWQAYEGRSNSVDSTQTSAPRPYGFAEPFTSVDGR